MMFDSLRSNIHELINTKLSVSADSSLTPRFKTGYGEIKKILLDRCDKASTEEQLHEMAQNIEQCVCGLSDPLLSRDTALQKILSEIHTTILEGLSAPSTVTQVSLSILSTKSPIDDTSSVIIDTPDPATTQKAEEFAILHAQVDAISKEITNLTSRVLTGNEAVAPFLEFSQRCHATQLLLTTFHAKYPAEDIAPLAATCRTHLLSATSIVSDLAGSFLTEPVDRTPRRERLERSKRVVATYNSLVKDTFELGRILFPDNPITSLARPNALPTGTLLYTAGSLPKTLGLISGGINMARVLAGGDGAWGGGELGNGIYCSIGEAPYAGIEEGNEDRSSPYVLCFEVIEELEGSAIPQLGDITSDRIALEPSADDTPREVVEKAISDIKPLAARAFKNIASQDTCGFLRGGALPPGDSELVLYRPQNKLQLLSIDIFTGDMDDLGKPTVAASIPIEHFADLAARVDPSHASVRAKANELVRLSRLLEHGEELPPPISERATISPSWQVL